MTTRTATKTPARTQTQAKTKRKARIVTKRRVRTSKGLKQYTYLGCPLTRNRTPWCFRLCTPDLEGHGRCGRVAPHGLKSRIQLGIENYNRKQLEAHCGKLERMYLAAPCNEYYEPGVRLSEGEAEIVIPIQDKFLDAAGSIHDSVCHRAMNDAALLAVSSMVQKALTLGAAFDIRLNRPIAAGELIARGRFMGVSDEHFLAEAVLTNKAGEEFGRGNGAFVRSEVLLSPGIGYE
jgi:acyl-coenzyme A thioesterase PaaI-like protein